MFGLLFFVAAAAVLAGAVILVRNSMQYSLDIVFSPDHASDSDAGTKSEAVQYAVPWLLRAGDAQDVAGNLLGLALGMTALALPCPRTRDGRSGEPQRPRRERTAR
ncbi:hypothetical protein [Streptomyces sp. SP2-10]|uniref:hypothetical protein n=1 Tax=Streptomyces sp. SP2-10 TaxID=2873385 RepID=UPI001CA62F84|nr:hypothetical protein [Streptomyces sp. SP2-10]MBY8840592.1 hypothetical protein [Streptomyces sp. SP2-10]